VFNGENRLQHRIEHLPTNPSSLFIMNSPPDTFKFLATFEESSCYRKECTVENLPIIALGCPFCTVAVEKIKLNKVTYENPLPLSSLSKFLKKRTILRTACKTSKAGEKESEILKIKELILTKNQAGENSDVQHVVIDGKREVEEEDLKTSENLKEKEV